MAQEKKKRNPLWQRDEIILALDLYFQLKHSEIDSKNAKVKELSQILNTLPIHNDRADLLKFRNPNGVAMKMGNFLRLDPSYKGKGLQRGSKLEEKVWLEFAHDKQNLHQIAQSIIAGIRQPSQSIIHTEEDFEEIEFPEGKVLYRMHRLRERNPKLVAQIKKQALKNGKLECQVCRFDFYKTYGELGKGYIECHHTKPVSSYKDIQKTTIKDLVLVCSNCHRMLHRRRPWLSIEDLSLLLK